MTKFSTMKGKRGEQIALSHLTSIGLYRGEIVETPYVVIARKTENPQWIKIRRSKKVTGDIHGHNSVGTHVLAEVKSGGERLLYSTMTKHGQHQIYNLDKQAEKAIALVVWVRDEYELYVLQWPISGFQPHTSITPERAQELNITDLG